jgi:hypothetical protein
MTNVCFEDKAEIVRTCADVCFNPNGHRRHAPSELVSPSIVNRTVMPQRRPNADLRTREHLTEPEVQRLMHAARKNRWGHRDATMAYSPIVTAFAPPSSLTFVGIRSSSPLAHYTSAGSSGARRAPIRSSGMSCAPCGDFSVSKTRNPPTSLRRSGAHLSPRRALPEWCARG